MNYGEAQGAESLKDFIHKMRVVLKELNESKVCLKLILKKSQLFRWLMNIFTVLYRKVHKVWRKVSQS